MRIVKAQLQNNYTSVIFDFAEDWIMKTVTTHNIAVHQINVAWKKNIVLSYKDHWEEYKVSGSGLSCRDVIENYIADSFEHSTSNKSAIFLKLRQMLKSLIRLSELGIFYVNNIIINVSNNTNELKLQALDYAQVINRANCKPKKVKLQKSLRSSESAH